MNLPSTRIILMSKKFKVSIFRGSDTFCPNSIVNLIDSSSSFKAFFSGNFVSMDKNFYRDVLVLEGHLNSNTYIKVASNEDNVAITNLKKLIKKHETV